MRPALHTMIIGMVLAAFSCAANAAAPCVRPTRPPFEDAVYYAQAQGLAGEPLKRALNGIVKGHTHFAYSCVWTILEELDADPTNPSNVIGFYGRRSIPKADRDTGGNTPDAWNREHVWANSHGFPSSSRHAYTDVHHLRAADKSINAARADFDFADGGLPQGECAGCRLDVDRGTWQAPDLVKGEVARIMFYMATRYEGDDGNGTPDLELVDALTSAGSPAFGDLCDLVQWHLDDPVSPEERARNAGAWAWQGNRNPFVDHPEFVLPIWGPTCGIAIPEPAMVTVTLPGWAPLALAILALAGARRRWWHG
jgi:serine protease